jgi:hypothetical protein
MALDKDEINQIRRRVEKRYSMRAEFISHLIAFLIFNAIMWFGLQPEGFFYGVAMIITGGWSIGLVIHGVQYAMFEMKEHTVQREIDRQLALRGEMVKPKRRYEISDDGELFVPDSDEDVYDEEPRRRSR